MLHSLNPLPSATFDPRLNYLDGPNPFGLTDPPRWFLQELWTFDALLVIFKSVEEPVYRLARRVEHGSPMLRPLTFMQRRPDAKIYAQHRLVPVTAILPSPLVAWSPMLLQDLAEHDIRRKGGFRSAASFLDEQDAAAEARWQRDVEDGAAVRARASWRGQKWTNGETVDLGGRKSHNSRTRRPSRVPGRTRRPGLRPRLGSGSPGLFIGRDTLLEEATPFLDHEWGQPAGPPPSTPLVIRAA